MDVYEYNRGSCKELECHKNKEEVYLRIDLEDFERVGPIECVEYGAVGVYSTTMYLIRNARTFHEVFMKNRVEIEVYKILKDLSERCDTKVTKYKDGYKVSDHYVRLEDNGEIVLNDKVINLLDLNRLMI